MIEPGSFEIGRDALVKMSGRQRDVTARHLKKLGIKLRQVKSIRIERNRSSITMVVEVRHVFRFTPSNPKATAEDFSVGAIANAINPKR